ncbi:glycoside hydrolase family 15 protein [bacterium]|nr:glycoside hydrolase family 15 protein [bacterium]
MYPFGLIGNCQTSSIITQKGSIDWLCFPRPDSPPVFGKLLDAEGGHFSIESIDSSTGIQSYIPNTNILETTLTCADGSQFRITDFCPRFYQHGRIYRPMSVFRKVEPLKGSPKIRVVCKPVDGWTKEPAKCIRGNSHLRYEIQNEYIRLVTNMSLTYLCEETPFSLKEPLYFGLTWSSGVEEDLVQLANRFLEQTADYWKTWVKHCSIPSLYQKETIRSALVLKLHCYEDTGAILAALTTSLPEEEGGSRNWDYRYCWLRDSYFFLTAFNNLGHFEETEGFMKFLINVAEKHDHSRERLRPVYCIDQSLPLPELEHSNWRGFRGSLPVRSGNQAAEHVQNDVYGEMILTLAPVFFDERFQHLRTPDHEKLLEHLARLCSRSICQPDAGLWELRNGWQEHTFSNLMCWAGLERIHRIQKGGYLQELNLDLKKETSRAEAAVRAAVKEGSVRNGPKDETYDAALLQLSTLRFPDEKLVEQTVLRIASELRFGADAENASFLYRYLRKDDFGNPKSAFLICSFWLVQALAKIGKASEAKDVMQRVMASANPLGLFAEHYLPVEKIQAGNFPQAYSHVGQINAAFAISPPWTEIL